MDQFTLQFEPLLPERFPSLRAFIAYRAQAVAKSIKVQAADMDIAPSTLSRKLHPAEGDTQRFNVDDLEAWIQSTGDCEAVVEFLASKYMDSDDAKRARVIAKVEKLSDELAQALALIKRGA